MAATRTDLLALCAQVQQSLQRIGDAILDVKLTPETLVLRQHLQEHGHELALTMDELRAELGVEPGPELTVADTQKRYTGTTCSVCRGLQHMVLTCAEGHVDVAPAYLEVPQVAGKLVEQAVGQTEIN